MDACFLTNATMSSSRAVFRVSKLHNSHFATLQSFGRRLIIRFRFIETIVFRKTAPWKILVVTFNFSEKVINSTQSPYATLGPQVGLPRMLVSHVLVEPSVPRH